MSLFGSLMTDVEDDPFFGSHILHMRQMNNMMNSLFSDPFGMLRDDSQLAIGGPRHTNALMPYMPQMPSLNRLFTADLDNMGMGMVMGGMGGMGAMSAMGGLGGMGGMGGMGSSFSSSTVVMSSGPHGKPQVYSSTSSTKIGPNGVKETKKTLQDSRTGTKKMSIGHHIGDRAHVIEREQNVYSGDAEEHQEFINLEEEEAEEFDREFQHKSGSAPPARRAMLALAAPAATASPVGPAVTAASAPQLPNTSSDRAARASRPASRRPIRANPLVYPSSVREVYGGSHPQRHRHKHHKTNRQ